MTQTQAFEIRLDPIARRARRHGQRHAVRTREVEEFDDAGEDSGGEQQLVAPSSALDMELVRIEWVTYRVDELLCPTGGPRGTDELLEVLDRVALAVAFELLRDRDV